MEYLLSREKKSGRSVPPRLAVGEMGSLAAFRC